MIFSVINFIFVPLLILTDSIICCFGFEPKNKEVKRWKVVLGLALVQMPPGILKFVFFANGWISCFCLFALLLFQLLFMIIVLEGYMWQKLMFIAFQESISFISEMIVQMILDTQLKDMTQLSYNQPLMVLYTFYVYILITLLFLLFLFIWKYFLKRTYDLKIFFIFSIFPVTQFMMMMSVNVKIFEGEIQWVPMMPVNILTAVIADAVLLYTLLGQQGMQGMQISLGETQKAWEIEQNHYLNIEARREELAKIRHDLSEQFLVIQELMHREEFEKAEEMLDTLREYTASTREYIYCADPVVNAILAEQEKRCQEKDIRFEYELSIVRPLSLNPVAICSIFSNLLKNAVAAAEKAENRQAAFVLVKADVKGDYLYIKVENTYRKEKTGEKKKRRGYGIDILKNLTEKYKGQMEVTQTDEKYSVQVLVENRGK